MADKKNNQDDDQLFDDLTGIEELSEGNEAYGEDPNTGISGELEEPPDTQTQSSIDLSGLLDVGPSHLDGEESHEDEDATETPAFEDDRKDLAIEPLETAEGSIQETLETTDLNAQQGDLTPPPQALAGSESDYKRVADEDFDISSPQELSQITQTDPPPPPSDISQIEEIKTALNSELSGLTDQNDIATEIVGSSPPPPPEAAKGSKQTPKETKPKPAKEAFEPLTEAPTFAPMDTSPATKQSYDAGSGERPMERVKSYSEKAVAAAASANPSFPFSLKVTGQIKDEFRQRVLDFFNQEKMGITPLDLEPQFDTGKLLIPRISEYAATILVQKLRGSGARIEVGPSDLIFSTPETRTSPNEPMAKSRSPDKHWVYDPSQASAADRIPLVASSNRHVIDPRNEREWKVVDAITATATLKSRLVEAKDSEEYKQLLNALELELKHKAYYKGANAVLDYKIHLVPLHSPTEYKLTLQGSAVKVRKRKKNVPNEQK